VTTLDWPAGPQRPVDAEPPAGPLPWGPKRAFAGLVAGLGAIAVVSILLGITWGVFGLPGNVQDAGGPLKKAEEITTYAHERAEAIADGTEIPDPPELFADVGSMRTAFGLTVVQQVLFVVVAVGVAGVGWRKWVHATGLHWYPIGSVWRPVAGALVAWFGVAVYGIITQLIGIDILIPQSTVPTEVQRDAITLAIVGVLTVIGAPISEEFLFRGLLFGGLTRWGFWPAALISGFIFSAIHLDPGSVIPFTIVGMILAWLFWHRGTLWDALICHALFNAASFSFLLLGALTYD
jgi:membrane protease YdiL (CAAX protease family)